MRRPNIDVQVIVGAGCGMAYKITNIDDVECTFGATADEVTLTIEGGSLRRFITMAHKALTELDEAQATHANNKLDKPTNRTT
ncbi:hypothetical protein [Actinokineospora inagensis]|uniref:hypothetical protein n=1 Tax=Actinokineospora inagensis TaxID=103730 RepID=UPI00041944E0|nr:hypothetical protein [Actinokineospora inagensis]